MIQNESRLKVADNTGAVVNEVQPLNMLSQHLLTNVVADNTGADVNDVQPLNMRL